MKRRILLAFAMAAMVSCSKNEVSDINKNNSNVINFSTYIGSDTKAENREVVTNSISEIGIYALSKNKNSFQVPYIQNDYLHKDNSIWTTSTPYYWPSVGNVDFYAYSPYTTALTITDDDSNGEGGGIISSNSFDIATTADKQIDILAAQPQIDKTKENSSQGVSLVFDHMLSKVYFNVFLLAREKGGLSVDFESIELVGVDGSHGGLDIKNKEFADDNALTPTTYSYKSSTPNFGYNETVVDDYYYKVNVYDFNGGEDFKSFMLLPQELKKWDKATVTAANADTQGAALKLSYKLIHNKEYIIGSENQYQTAYFPLPSDTEWKAGYSYLYSITFNTHQGFGNGGYKTDGKGVLDGRYIEFDVDVARPDKWYDSDMIYENDYEILKKGL